MKTKITLKALALSIIIYSIALLSSCSTSNQISSQNPHYHLTLVKADTHAVPADKKEKATATSDIAPMQQHGSLVSYQSDDQFKEINDLLKADMKTLKKQAKRSDPEIYKQIKNINITKAARQLMDNTSNVSRNNRSSVTKNAQDVGGGGGRYFGLWLTFLIIAIIFFIFTLVIPILYIFGLISLLASAIFFILWIVSLA